VIPLAALEGTRHSSQSKKHGLKCADFVRFKSFYAILLMWLLFTNALATGSKVLCVNLYLIDHFDVSKSELGFYATAGNLGSLMGSFTYGWLSHAHARGQIHCISRYVLDKSNLVLACVGQAAMLVLMVICTTQLPTYGVFFVLQFFWSGWMIYSRALVLNFCPPGSAGSFAAVMFAAPNVGQVTGPMLGGAMSDRVGAAAACIITAILFMIPGVFSFCYPKPDTVTMPGLTRSVSTVTETDVDTHKTIMYEKLDDDVLIDPTQVAHVGINDMDRTSKKTRALNSKSRS